MDALCGEINHARMTKILNTTLTDCLQYGRRTAKHYEGDRLNEYVIANPAYSTRRNQRPQPVINTDYSAKNRGTTFVRYQENQNRYTKKH